MTVINSLVLDQSIRSINLWISNFTFTVKPGNYPVLMTGGVEVDIEVRQTETGFELVCKMDQYIVNREMINLRQAVNPTPFFAIYDRLSKTIPEIIYENALISDCSLTKLMYAICNRSNINTDMELPGGFLTRISADSIVIKKDEEEIELMNFDHNGIPLSPTLCIPKTIANVLQTGDFKPFII